MSWMKLFIVGGGGALLNIYDMLMLMKSCVHCASLHAMIFCMITDRWLGRRVPIFSGAQGCSLVTYGGKPTHGAYSGSFRSNNNNCNDNDNVLHMGHIPFTPHFQVIYQWQISLVSQPIWLTPGKGLWKRSWHSSRGVRHNLLSWPPPGIILNILSCWR